MAEKLLIILITAWIVFLFHVPFWTAYGQTENDVKTITIVQGAHNEEHSTDCEVKEDGDKTECTDGTEFKDDKGR